MTKPANLRRESAPTPRAFAQGIEEDLGFQLRSWRAQRAGWALGLLLLVAALAGLMGNGPLSQADASSEDGALTVHYDRLVRHGSPTKLDVRVDQALAAEGAAVVWIDREFLHGLELEAVVPEPVRVVDGDGRTGYEFELSETGDDALDVSFFVQYDDPFVRTGRFAVGNGPDVSFQLFVFP